MHDLHISENVAVLGISLYVLGFALGYVTFTACHVVRINYNSGVHNNRPLVFAPMGEVSRF